MEMIDFSEMFDFVINAVTQNYEDYLDDPEKFVKSSIEEFCDDTDIKVINDAYDIIIDDLDACIVEYEEKWQ